MGIKLSSAGPLIDEGSSRFITFIDTVLRGIGQVFLQNNSYAGLLFLIGIFYNSALFGMGVLVGTIISTLSAIAFGATKEQIRSGLFGFNGALVGIALLYFLQPNALTWAYVIFASVCSSVVMSAAIRLLDVWKMPTLTSPFVLTTLCFLLACARLGRLESTHILPNAGLPVAATVEGIVTASTLLEGFIKGIAQVFFQDNIITGIFFLLGLLVSSKRACMMAMMGSLTGLLIAWGLGAAEPSIRSGGFGFNPVLTAVAMGSFLNVLSFASMAYVFLATVTTVIAFAAISATLEPLGMPALTLPFVLVVWLFLLGKDDKKITP